MWLITPVGFFSVVQKPADVAAGTLTVRSRVRSDLDELRAILLPELSPTKETASADYRFRAQAPKEAVAAAMAKLAPQRCNRHEREHQIDGYEQRQERQQCFDLRPCELPPDWRGGYRAPWSLQQNAEKAKMAM